MNITLVLNGISYLNFTSLTIIVQSNAKAWHFYFSPNTCKWTGDQHNNTVPDKVNNLILIAYVIFEKCFKYKLKLKNRIVVDLEFYFCPIPLCIIIKFYFYSIKKLYVLTYTFLQFSDSLSTFFCMIITFSEITFWIFLIHW